MPSLSTFALIVSAHPYCARKFTCIEHARKILNWTTIGQMAIVIALLGFNDLGSSVTPVFLFRNGFYLHLSPHCPKINKNQCGKLKKFQDFCPRDMECVSLPLLFCVSESLSYRNNHQVQCNASDWVSLPSYGSDSSNVCFRRWSTTSSVK